VSRWLAISESVLSDSNGLRRHLRSISFSGAEALVELPHGRRQPGSIGFLKNDTMFSLTWQEIVDFP
jgi:hypothetical protein